MNFGPLTEEKEAFAIMDHALEEGVNFFDTANVYGGWGSPDAHAGWTEEILGRWFALGGGRRESVFLATKVHGAMKDKTDGPNDEDGLSAWKIRRHIEGSLRRLQTDHIDLYQMHHVAPHATWEELWGVFEPLAAEGKIVYAGSSNFGARHLAYAQAAANNRHFLGLVCEQHKYSLNCRLPELELLPTARDLGLGVIPWSPLDGGYLSGHVLNAGGGSRSAEVAANLTPAQREQLEAFHALCQELGESEADVAIAWLLTNPVVTAPIIGPRTMEQFESNLHAADITLTPETMAKLDEIFPGPGGEAPAAYAW
jgi:aryl-alcohol dehydrogenase-like predicted oxidoreductase